MKSVTDPALVAPAIDDVDRRTHGDFDAHDVIKRLMDLYPAEYAADLTARSAEDSAVRVLHSELGRVIADICRQEGFEGQPSRSPDIHGQSSKCTRWRRAPRP